MKSSFLQKLLILLMPLSVLVRLVYRIRRYLFVIDHYESVKFKPRTISIGNVTMGGTGKTPFLKWLLDQINCNLEVLVSSRGYRSDSESNEKIILVKSKINEKVASESYSAKEIGDENIELLSCLKTGGLAVGKKRTSIIRKALKRKRFDLILLDDGFQHLQINRDLNVVLFNSMMDPSLLRVFPAGTLREGLASLYSADLVIYTNCLSEKISHKESILRSRVRPYLSKYAAEFRSKTILKQVIDVKSGQEMKDFNDQPFVLVSAIASPGKFRQLVESENVNVLEHMSFPDHHFFCEKDYERINEAIEQYNAPVLLTRKDVAKFDCNMVGGSVFVCDVEISFFGKEQLVLDLVLGD